MKAILLSLLMMVSTSHASIDTDNFFDNFDPRSPDIDKILKDMDEDYEQATGKSSKLEFSIESLLNIGCYRNACPVWADVDINTQQLNLYLNGALTYTWLVSSGKRGYDTPDFDQHPDGRIYDSYSSSRYPGGDYNGLGNMPYAVFISGGYAIHGTTRGNWPLLGRRASHGCIRLHPNNAKIFNILNRKYGLYGVWITVN